MAACRFTCDHVAITRHRVEQRVPKPRYLGTQESFKCQPFLSVKLGRNIAVRARNSGDAGSKSDAPDWDAEMSIFKKRTMKPGQLAALRQTEGEASLGKVVFNVDDLIIVEGLNNDADVGTVVSFASGVRGVLLWRRNDNLCFIMAPGGGSIPKGTPVRCNVEGVVQVVDEAVGAVTKRKYEAAKIRVENVEGEVVNYSGQIKGSSAPVSLAGKVPLLAKCPDMENRETINQPLFTGVAAVDTLTPLGRGQSILVAGLRGSGKTDLLVEAIIGQRSSGVRCVMSLIGEEEGFADELKRRLQVKGAMGYTTIVEAPKGSTVSQCYTAMCTAMSIAETVRDNGGHAFVLHDNMVPMVQLWELLTEGLTAIGSQGLASSGRDSMPAVEDSEDEKMVEYAGMLISASAAQRRQFFAAMIQRGAKLHRRLGGGSLTMLGCLPGTPATGIQKKKQAIIQNYKTLSSEQRARMLAVLEEQEKLQGVDPDQARRGIQTEVVEEFMSLTDGQIVLESERDASTGCMVVSPSASVSRIGSRAYEPALADIAMPIKFSIAQADDARRSSIDGSAEMDIGRALRARAVLVQDLESPVALEELVVKLLALQVGAFDDVDPTRVKLAASMCVHDCWLTYPEILKEVRNTRALRSDDRETLLHWLQTREIP